MSSVEDEYRTRIKGCSSSKSVPWALPADAPLGPADLSEEPVKAKHKTKAAPEREKQRGQPHGHIACGSMGATQPSHMQHQKQSSTQPVPFSLPMGESYPTEPQDRHKSRSGESRILVQYLCTAYGKQQNTLPASLKYRPIAQGKNHKKGSNLNRSSTRSQITKPCSCSSSAVLSSAPSQLQIGTRTSASKRGFQSKYPSNLTGQSLVVWGALGRVNINHEGLEDICREYSREDKEKCML
ncbi:hypothetical protein F511_04537 [Dorcoceras hygrometricum]|uniref:Uncharacterized protein n=1 Tax=Dorcoceras hygrometricum TaxID=472368 RepID=A0A2Z7C5R4_9LAMI|nr:hypothetical protein F511_04537 [Dorcoceras hygrometricum]